MNILKRLIQKILGLVIFGSFCYEIFRKSVVAILVNDFYAKVADQSDKNTATRIVSPSVEFYASGSDVPVGFDDFFDYVSMFQRALAFKHVILETLVVKTVLIYWRVEGTHKKELLGCALPTKQLSTQACRCSILMTRILFQKLLLASTRKLL